MNFEEIVQKAVNVKAITGLKSSTIIQDLDIFYFKGHSLSNSTASKVQTQGITAKNSFRPKKPKTKETKFVYTDATEFFEPVKKENKQKKFKLWQNCTRKPK